VPSASDIEKAKARNMKIQKQTEKKGRNDPEK
jgi:hypothetical protein